MPESVFHGPPLKQAKQAETSPETADESSRRILIYRIGSIGDTIIALPAMWVVRHRFPRAHIAFLGNAHESGNYVLAQSVLPAEGLFDQWLTYPTGHGRTRPSREVMRLFFQLRRQRFDTLVYLAPRARGKRQILRDLSFFYGTGIRHFVGHRGIDPLPVKIPGQPFVPVVHEADHLLHRLELSGLATPPAGERRMDMAITGSESELTRAWLYENCGEAMDEGRIVGIGPGSNWSSKMWPEERYAALGEGLIKEHDIYPLVFGGPEDIERNERLIARWGRGANAAGQLTVRQGAAALGECRLYVGNDTGTMHLAAAMGTPCVVACSAQDLPGRWYPYGEGHTVFRHAVPCEGCHLRVCDRDLQCLKLIEVDEVFDACRRILTRSSQYSQQVELNACHEISTK